MPPTALREGSQVPESQALLAGREKVCRCGHYPLRDTEPAWGSSDPSPTSSRRLRRCQFLSEFHTLGWTYLPCCASRAELSEYSVSLVWSPFPSAEDVSLSL